MSRNYRRCDDREHPHPPHAWGDYWCTGMSSGGIFLSGHTHTPKCIAAGCQAVVADRVSITDVRFLNGERKPLYTLDEAKRIFLREACQSEGHQWVIQTDAEGDPTSLICARQCGVPAGTITFQEQT